MSHPENTLKEIIETIRGTIHELNETNKSQLKMSEIQNKEIDRLKSKIDLLVQIIGSYVQTMYTYQGNIGMEQGKEILEMLDKVRKL